MYTDLRNSIIEADLVWINNKFQSGIQICCDANGNISEIGTNLNDDGGRRIVRLPNQAILPGFINAHSHAFHRAMRGNSHIGCTDGDSFWRWRDNMYHVVETQMNTPDRFYDICRRTFTEMIRTGITTVGEFHYLHHSTDNIHQFDFDEIILQAADDVGIRLVLIETYYRQASIDDDKVLASAQRRFVSQSVEQLCKHINRLQSIIDGRRRQTLAIAAHSIRAVSAIDIEQLWIEAKRLHLPFHMHLEEQPLEISAAQQSASIGMSPSDFVLNRLKPNQLFTAIHATHTTAHNFGRLLDDGANICICPLTEGFLGDGIPNVTTSTTNISFGTDCNNRLSMLEEMRMFAYCQQMKHNSRSIAGGLDAIRLIDMATRNGARSLGLQSIVGQLTVGRALDFVAFNINSKTLNIDDGNNLIDAIVFGAGNLDIETVCIDGQIRFANNSQHDVCSKSSWISKDIQQPTTTGMVTRTKTDIKEFLVSLMRIESTTKNEGQIAHALADYLHQFGWHCHLQSIDDQPNRMNLLATRRNNHLSPRILFNSHLDTVPPYIAPTIDGDRICGRGSCDAKGQIAAMIFAMHQLIDRYSNDTIIDQIGLLFVVGEETDHIGIKEASSKLNLTPDYLIVGEPTELKFARAQKGALKFRLVATGRAAHSGYPEKGHSAIETMLDVLNDLRAYDWPSDIVLGKTTMNIGKVSGGHALNALAEYCETSIMFRIVDNCEHIIDLVESIINDRVIMDDIIRNEPIHQLDILNNYTAQTVAFNTDIPYWQGGQLHGIYLFGAGSITDAHSNHEFVIESDLHQAINVYVELIEYLLKLK